NDEFCLGLLSDDWIQEHGEKFTGRLALRLPGPYRSEVVINEFFDTLAAVWKHDNGRNSAGNSQAIRLSFAKNVLEEHLIPTERCLNGTERDCFPLVIERKIGRASCRERV